MKLKILEGDYAVCQIREPDDKAHFPGDFVSLTRTRDEISLVCREEGAPRDCIRKETGWICLQICGVLEFSLVGILAELTGVLAENNIPVFAVSTYNTDYVLIRKKLRKEAVAALLDHGYRFDTSLAGRSSD